MKAVLVAHGFGRFTKADLVGCDDPVTGLAQRIDTAFPRAGAEILAVHQHNCPAVRRLRFDVDIGHLQLLALGLEFEAFDRAVVVEPFQFGSITWRFGRHRGQGCREAEGRQQALHGQSSLCPGKGLFGRLVTSTLRGGAVLHRRRAVCYGIYFANARSRASGLAILVAVPRKNAATLSNASPKYSS